MVFGSGDQKPIRFLCLGGTEPIESRPATAENNEATHMEVTLALAGSFGFLCWVIGNRWDNIKADITVRQAKH